jgi:hypothetical protein
LDFHLLCPALAVRLCKLIIINLATYQRATSQEIAEIKAAGKYRINSLVWIDLDEIQFVSIRYTYYW